MTYSQLTFQERYLIQRCHQNGESQSEIAEKLGRHRSTIGRELRRNTCEDGDYQADDAARQARKRARSGGRTCKVTTRLWAHIQYRLRRYWSPEQIAHELAISDGPGLSHEWIYQLIYADKASGGDLWTYLRHPRPRRKHQKPDGETRGRIPNRRPIGERPEVVEEKKRIGDWEIDLVEGAKGSGYLLTLVERKTAFTVIGGLQKATAPAVRQLTADLLEPFVEDVHTITCDNGKEFAGHSDIAQDLECEVYFADAYSPSRRGLNENTNGLLRQFFPKGCDMRTFEPKHLRAAMYLLNNRPRKTLDFQQPQLLFAQQFP